jgi:zinc D-Ala-D-Ala carboxypeptidase|tara:strand:+ start:294 stop:755 length:462 start_codon:yes stop_codon:yes gene_type:complete
MKLSNNLSVKEVTKSNTAKRFGIDNRPTIEHLQNLKAIALNIFQPARNHFKKPIFVSSGYRSEDLNEKIGGSKTSQHSKGQALDLDAHTFGGLTNKELFDFISEHLEFDQIIWEFGTDEEPDWVHVSYVSSSINRGESLKAYKANGITKYKHI